MTNNGLRMVPHGCFASAPDTITFRSTLRQLPKDQDLARDYHPRKRRVCQPLPPLGIGLPGQCPREGVDQDRPDPQGARHPARCARWFIRLLALPCQAEAAEPLLPRPLRGT